MKKLILLFLFSTSAFSQVIVDEKDLNVTAESFQVYLMTKPFNTKESIFADTGTNNFRIHYYNSKRQKIFDANGKEFENGSYLRLNTYLIEQGWIEKSQRPAHLGDVSGTCIIYTKSKPSPTTTSSVTKKYDTLEGYCIKITEAFDKFENKKTFSAPKTDGVGFLKSGDEVFISLQVPGANVESEQGKSIILLADGKRIEKSSLVSAIKVGTKYEYLAVVKLQPQDVDQIISSPITDFRVLRSDVVVNNGKEIQEYLKCILNK